MSSTLDELTTQVYAPLRDDRREFIKESMVVAWLNDAQRDLASRVRELVLDTITGTVGEDAGSYYAADGTTDLAAARILLPTELIMVRVVKIGTTEIVHVDDEVFNSYLEVSGSSPLKTIYRIASLRTYDNANPAVQTGYREFIEFSPDQTSNDYSLTYTRMPAEMSDPNDVCEVPEYLETRMVNYARAHAKWQQGEQRQGDNYYALFEQNLPAPPNGHVRVRPGPITLAYEGNGFDHQLDAAHRG